MPENNSEKNSGEASSNQNMDTKVRFAYFGTPEIAVTVLNELEKVGYAPALVVTNADRPKGRKQVITPPPVKVWAEQRGIEIYQPETLRDGAAFSKLSEMHAAQPFELFIVAAYGKIIPKNIIELPRRGTLNMHPSLLPKFRGPSPIISVILADQRETGVSIMLLDEQMDHGPIVAQEPTTIPPTEWPMSVLSLEPLLARQGGSLLARTIPGWIAGTINARPQDETAATYCKMINKADGELDIANGDAYQNFLKIQAFAAWPGTYFFHTNTNGTKNRVIIKEAVFENNTLILKRVVPEGKNEMSYSEFVAKR